MIFSIDLFPVLHLAYPERQTEYQGLATNQYLGFLI